MSKDTKKLIEYDARNGVYNIDGETEVKSLGFLTGVQKERSITTKDIYGDGEVQKTAVTESNSSATIGLTAKDEDFDKDLGYLQDVTGGVAEVSVTSFKLVNIGFETTIETTTGVKAKKVWLLGCQVSPSSDSWQQNTDSTNEVNASYSVSIKGVKLQDETGEAEYKDSSGMTKTVQMMSSTPGDGDTYETFLSKVPTPTVKTSATDTVAIPT